ncbi:carbamoyltransferase HypF [Carbonactinospora thermoautotrophica]|uniref:carbamoyltransferase HypF n=1 Tax=Carbonactinospora thermoautotrophica TaxID=1469144 RepID=UPI00226FBFAF|nr:carbamoyltransferase HypF [Carbonactinospora thermoautotrophica]
MTPEDFRELTRTRIRVEGIVQGVGFRPFVHSLATELGLTGFVGNDAYGVFAEVEGKRNAVRAFLDGLRTRAPALAVVETVTAEEITPVGSRDFTIVASQAAAVRDTLISADTATCADCLAELFDPADRRYRYPFINCTNCGPRFTIVTGIPYDRSATTMAAFPMCAQCAEEYRNPADRRFHAQPVCCPDCGPSLTLVRTSNGRWVEGDPVRRTVRLLAEGRIVAVKGLGGYHLAVDAASEAAVAALRARKHREDKPFALMCPDLDTVRALCELGPIEEATLTSRRRPIVLLARRPDAQVAPSVAPGNRFLGVMLPYTPLHHLLAHEFGRPFVLTSGNVSDEPIAYTDDDARARLAGIADAFLMSNRDIHMRTDDSVVRVVRGREVPIRRSRGYVPEPISLPWEFPRPVLACGAELKNVFCLAKGRRVFVSHHIGDLENYETLRSFTSGIEHFRRLFDVHPRVVAHDLHPEYLSTKYALELDGVDLVGVQHHHAHIASCLADNREAGPVIGVAFDGLGYGTDGTLWGGEILVTELTGFRRVGHLAPVRMPGGAAAIREPWRMAAAYALAAYGEEIPDLAVARRHLDQWDSVLTIAASGVSAPVTTSAGRLFDAVAALVGIRDAVNYEGQAAVELEQRVDPGERGAYPCRVEPDPLLIHGIDLVRDALDDLDSGVDVGRIAARFHNGLAQAVVAAVEVVRQATALDTVALSGGVFQNVVLLDRLVDLLEARGFRVLTHSRVPPNDGGISLGQAAVVGALDRAQ